MADYPDQPDYQQAVTPGVTRWAPGTSFGSVVSTGAFAGNSEHDVNYAIPNDGYRYVVDKSFTTFDGVGVFTVIMEVCLNYAAPTWVQLAVGVNQQVVELSPFEFVSMSIRYPQGLRWRIFNTNNIVRNYWLYANIYRYMATG